MKATDASTPPSRWSVGQLGSFFVEKRPEFLSHARRVTQNLAQAEEIVQDSLVRVLLACPELESVDHATAYFHRVIENLSIDLHRREGRRPSLVLLDEATSEIEAKWSIDPDFSEVIATADDAAIIREAISLLSPAERAALVMWEFEGRSKSEIATELGIKESAVRHTVSRARAGLRKILSERIIDEERGLTALDFLSISVRKVHGVARNSSRVALSFVLVFSAFLGFNSLIPLGVDSNESVLSVNGLVSKAVPSQSSPKTSGERAENDVAATTAAPKDSGGTLSKKSETNPSSVAMTGVEFFPGLDSDGVPTGFTVADSRGNLGTLFSGQQRLLITESGFLLSGIVSTKSGAVNVLINQSIVFDAFGTSYVGKVSVGIEGGWQPLRLSVISSDVERLASGNYLLTAIMMVDSVLETSIKVSTGTSGTDLSSAPEYLSTRVLLDPTKSKILAQAVLVSADSQGDGA
jgi:RNA polymerase sigma factor (sigma-70 family)